MTSDRILVCLVLAMALLATTPSHAGGITDEQVAALKVGVTTYTEVIRQFGNPTVVETLSDGRKTVVYSRTRTRVKAATFVPVVGLFAGGAKANVSTQRFEFGSDGVLRGTYNSQAQVNCGVWGNCAGGLPGGGTMPSTPTPAASPPASQATREPVPAATPSESPPMVKPAPVQAASTETLPAPAATTPTPAAAKPCGMIKQRDGTTMMVPCT